VQFTLNLKANQPQRQQTAGRYFLLLSTGVAPSVQVGLYAGTQELENIRTAQRGFKARVWKDGGTGGFSHVDLLSTVDCTLEIIISDGTVDFDFITGTNVQATIAGPLPLPVTNDRGSPGTPVYVSGLTYSDAPATAVNNTAPVAVTAANTAVVALNASRKALRLTNNGPDPVAVGGAGLTWANRCIVLGVGDIWVEERGANVAWSAICDAAKTASLAIQEVIA